MEILKAIFFASFVLSAVLAETESDNTTTVESNEFRSGSVGSLKNLNLPDPNSKVVKVTPSNNDKSGYVENDCYCNLKREHAGPTVSQTLNPTGEDEVERLVVHLYREKKNPEQVYVYIPDRKKQYAAPDLELGPYDLLQAVTSKVLRDFLTNNPYVIEKKRFPNVPDFGVDDVSYNKHKVRQYRERFVYQFVRPKNPYVFLFENLVTYSKKLPRVFKKLRKDLYYTIKQHPEYLTGPDGSTFDFNDLYHTYEKENQLTDLLQPPYKPGQQLELPSLDDFEPGTFDENKPFGVPKHPRPFESGHNVLPDNGKENRPAKEVYPELEPLPHPGGHKHEVAVTPNHHHHHHYHHRPEKEFFFITNPTDRPAAFVKPSYHHHFVPFNTSFLPARTTDVPTNQRLYPDFGNTLYPTTTDGLDVNSLPARALDHPDTSVPDFPSGFTVTPDFTEFDKLSTNNYPTRPAKPPAGYWLLQAYSPDDGTNEDHPSTNHLSYTCCDDLFPIGFEDFGLPKHPHPSQSGHDLLPDFHKPTATKLPYKTDFLPAPLPAKPDHNHVEKPGTVDQFGLPGLVYPSGLPGTVGPFELPSNVNLFELPSTVDHKPFKPAPGLESENDYKLTTTKVPAKPDLLPAKFPAKPGASHEKFELPSTFVTEHPFKPYDFSKDYPSTKLPARPGHNHGGDFELPSTVNHFELPSTVYPFERPSKVNQFERPSKVYHKPAPGFESGEDLLPEFLPGQLPAKPDQEKFKVPSTFVTEQPFKPYDFSKPYPSTNLPAQPGHNQFGNFELPSKVSHFELPSTFHHKPAPGFESGENLFPHFTYPEKNEFLPGQLPAKPGHDTFDQPSEVATNYPSKPYDFSKPYPSTDLPARPGHNHGSYFERPSKVNQFEGPSKVHHKPAPGFESGEDLLPEFLPGQLPAKPGHENFEVPTPFVTEHRYDFSKPYPSTKLPARPGHNHGEYFELPSKVNDFKLPTKVNHKPAPSFESGDNLLPDFTYPDKTKFLPGQLPAKPGRDIFELPSKVATNYPPKLYDFSKPYPSTKLPAQPGHNQFGNFELPSNVSHIELPSTVHHKPAPGFESGENLLPQFTYPEKNEFLPGQLPAKPGHDTFDPPREVATNYPSKPYDFSKPYLSTDLPARPGHNHGEYFELPSKVNDFKLPTKVNHKPAPGYESGENLLPDFTNADKTKFLPGQLPAKPGRDIFELPSSFGTEHPFKPYDFSKPYPSTKLPARPGHDQFSNFELPSKVSHFELPSTVHHKPAPGFESGQNLLPDLTYPEKTDFFPGPLPAKPGYDKFVPPSTVKTNYPSKPYEFSKPYPSAKLPARPGHSSFVTEQPYDFSKPYPSTNVPVRPGHNQVDNFELPSKGDHFEVPGSVNHFDRPTKGEHFELPGSVNQFELPSTVNHFELPGTDNHFERPIKGERFKLPGSVYHYERPFKGELFELPGSVNHFERPSKGEHVELPGSVNHYELPSKGEHIELPGSVNHYKLPSKGEHFELPGSVNHFERPSKGEHYKLPGSVNYFERPSKGKHFELPGLVNHYEQLSKGERFELPGSVNHFVRPSQGEHFELPGLVNHYEQPSKGERFELPDSVNHFERPSQGEHFELPGSVNHFERPSKGEHFELPGSVNHFERPSQGEHFERPSQGEHFELPGSVNHFERPSKFYHYELPGSVNEYPGFKYETAYNDYGTDAAVSHKPYSFPFGPPGSLYKETKKEFFGSNQLHYELQAPVNPVNTNPKVIKKNHTFDTWFEKEFASLGTEFKQNSNIDGGFDINAVKQLIQSVLKSNGIAITKHGFLVNSDGQPLNTRELKLRPILVGNAIGLHTLLSESKLKIPPHSYFLNILVTFKSSKVLGVVPVGKSNPFALKNIQTNLPAAVKVVKTGGYEENRLASAHQPSGTIVRYTVKRPVVQHGRVMYSKPKLQQYKYFFSGNTKTVGENLSADLRTSQVKAKTQIHLNKLNLGAKKSDSSIGVNLNTQGLFVSKNGQSTDQAQSGSKNGESTEQAQSGEATLNERLGNDENVEDNSITNSAKKEETKFETKKLEKNRGGTELRLDEEKEQAKQAPTERSDSDERKEQTESLPAFRIMGGNAATQSGSAIKGRGRSGRG